MIQRIQAFDSRAIRDRFICEGNVRDPQKHAPFLDFLFSNVSARSWVAALALPLLLLVGLPVQAKNYSFDGLLAPLGCVSTSNNNFTCVSLTLGVGESLTISGDTRITVLGALSTGATSRINAAGPANLTLVVHGLTDLGADSVMKANLSSPAGAITIGARSSVTGTLTTDTAAIKVGASSTVTGSITSTAAGAVTVGEAAIINGNISTNIGAVTTGARSVVTGNIVTTVGAVTIGGNVDGKINSVGISEAGAVTVAAGSNITGFITTGAGAVTLGADSKARGVATKDGAITIGAGSTVSGSLCTGSSGAITVGAGSNVSGNVTTKTAGAITIGALAKVSGAVTVENAGAASIAAGATVGTSKNSSQCADAAPELATPFKAPTLKSREWRQIFIP